MWIERTTFVTAYPLPGILRWFVVTTTTTVRRGLRGERGHPQAPLSRAAPCPASGSARGFYPSVRVGGSPKPRGSGCCGSECRQHATWAVAPLCCRAPLQQHKCCHTASPGCSLLLHSGPHRANDVSVTPTELPLPRCHLGCSLAPAVRTLQAARSQGPTQRVPAGHQLSARGSRGFLGAPGVRCAAPGLGRARLQARQLLTPPSLGAEHHLPAGECHRDHDENKREDSE